jgi:hypothetical protein
VFGGATLQDFAFAIMVGIVIGAVGTIFIATPLLATLMEREPEYARRKAAAESDAAALRESETAIAAEPAPTTVHDVIEGTAEEPLVPVGAESEINGEGDGDGDEGEASRDAKRERRRERRKARPHGRPR